MKPAPFRYADPRTVDDAVAALAAGGDGAKVLAGGQSLLPLLSMRLAAPSLLVDINRIPGLDTVTTDGSGVTVGAAVRHAALLADPSAYAVQPLLRQASTLVAHPAIRNRGTTCGSLAHADPAGEMTAVLALTGGAVVLRSPAGERTVAAADFFTGPLEADLRPGELLVGAHFPAFPAGTGSAFLEVSRRRGDYALVGVAAAVTRGPDGRVSAARAAYLAVGPTPVVLDLTDAAPDWVAAGRSARDRVEPEADIHATADYRRQLVEVLTARALAAADADAGTRSAAA